MKTKGPLRLVSVVVLVVLSISTVAVSLIVKSIVEDQEQRLLHERTAEAGLVITTVFGGARITLPVLAATTRPSEASTAAFEAAAQPLRGPVGAIGALRVSDGVVTVLAVSGEGPERGTVLTGDRAALALRAIAVQKMASAVLDGPGGRQLTFAVAAGDTLVLYQELPLAVFAGFEFGPDDPFSELTGAVYAAPREDASKLLLASTDDLPLSGKVDRHPVEFGADTWLLVTRSNEPLVGTFAAKAPWGVLASGLLAALLTTILVETLVRRRVYALALVEERTQELQEALDKQARLERGERHARQLAEAANRSKSDFLSRMSHELRTPLNAVLGFGQLLELDDLTEPQTEAVEQIVKGGRHLLHLINEVLDISRIESGALSLSPEPVHVDDVITDTLTLMRPLADHREIRLTHDHSPAEAAHVTADRQRLKQIMLNLVANAVKYNKHGGEVVVSSTTVDDGWLRITVADTGPGIHSDDIDKLFTPFERLGAERSDVEGAGVGLALSRRLAEAMGGTIGVESTYGEGSRFSVELPLAVNPLDDYERVHGVAPGADDAHPGVPSRHKVLYVEDNLSNVRLVERILEQRRDIEVVPAMQGSLGLALAREHGPALILLDLHLPDIGGEEVLRELREDPATSGIPVVVVSADATTRQIERLLAAGATAYLTKPLDVRQFVDLLNATIDEVGAARA